MIKFVEYIYIYACHFIPYIKLSPIYFMLNTVLLIIYSKKV